MTHVQIADTIAEIEYSGQSGTGPFSFSFVYFQKSDLEVLIDDVVIAESNWSVTPSQTDTGGFTGGEITLTTTITNQKVTITRKARPGRLSDFATGGAKPDDINSALDLIHAIARDLLTRSDRGLQFGPDDNGYTPVIGDATARASKYLGFDSSGNVELITSPPTATGVDDINNLPARTAFESGDKLQIWETGVGNRQIDHDDLPGANVFEVEADLITANIPAETNFVTVMGYGAIGDGGGHVKKRIATPSPAKAWHKQSADGAWWEIAEKEINPLMLGATGDGVANDYQAVFDADAAATALSVPLVLTKTHLLNTSFSTTTDLYFRGGILKPAAATTVTVNNGIDARIRQIFDISVGTVDLKPASLVYGYAEWFGATPNSEPAASANTAIINAAIVATPYLRLQAADYFVDGKVTIQEPNHVIEGQSSLYDSVYGTKATRLIMIDGSTDVLQIGPDAEPGGGISAFPRGIKAKGIQVQRSVAPVISSDCKSIKVRYVLEAYLEDMRGDDSMHSWEFHGVVNTKVFNCSAKRTAAGTGAGSETWRGFYINGNSGIAAGGNASLYLIKCHADDTRAVVTDGNGFYIDGNYSDLFLDTPETVTCSVGINIQGNGAVGSTFGNTDIHITNPIMDQFTVYGIYVYNIAEAGSVDINMPYCGPAAGATSAIQVTNSDGSTNIQGGQLVLGAATSAYGIRIVNSDGVRAAGTQLLEGTPARVVLDDARSCDIRVIIKNRAITGGAGVQLFNTCVANRIEPIILGKTSGTSLGIQVVGTGDQRNEYNLTGIDSNTIAGGSANKLVRNGVQITATGLSGTNLVSGVVT